MPKAPAASLQKQTIHEPLEAYPVCGIMLMSMRIRRWPESEEELCFGQNRLFDVSCSVDMRDELAIHSSRDDVALLARKSGRAHEFACNWMIEASERAPLEENEGIGGFSICTDELASVTLRAVVRGRRECSPFRKRSEFSRQSVARATPRRTTEHPKRTDEIKSAHCCTSNLDAGI